MQSFLLHSGAQALSTQAGSKLQVAGFQIGNRAPSFADITGWDITEPSLTTMQGTLVHSATESAVTWSQTGVDEIRLTCVVDETVPQIDVGNVVLLVRLGTTIIPFSYSATHDAVTKLAAGARAAGIRYQFYLVLKFPDVMQRFDFGNLVRPVPEWETVPHEWALPDPLHDSHDQLVINNHRTWGGAHPVFKVRNHYYGIPFVQALSGNTFPERWTLSGGVSGDNYKRI